MTTALYTHAAFLQHDTGPGHPERIQRLGAVLQAVKDEAFNDVVWREAPLAEIAQIERVHDADYVRHALASVPEEG